MAPDVVMGVRFPLTATFCGLGITMLVACDVGDFSPKVEPLPPVEPEVLCDDSNVKGSLMDREDVVAVESVSCGPYVEGDAQCFLVGFQQPVDHGEVEGATFVNAMRLIHRSCQAPVVVTTNGYSLFPEFYPRELSELYGANHLEIEHRFAGASAPNEENWSWDALTIENGAADIHRIASALRPVYTGNWVTTGASKNGITAIYHHYLYPDDVDGTVAYVAPASLARVDGRYQDYFATIGEQSCGTEVRAAQVAMLTTHREYMLDQIATVFGSGGESWLESLVRQLDWAFWQYEGESACAVVPPVDGDGQSHWEFVDFVYGDYFPNRQHPATPTMESSIGLFDGNGQSDEERDQYVFYYEWLTEQGFADQLGEHVETLLEAPPATMEERFVLGTGVELPAYDGELTMAVREWIEDEAENVVLVYGENDPWSGGQLPMPRGSLTGKFFAPGGSHTAVLADLPAAEKVAALQLVDAMMDRASMKAAIPVARAQERQRRRALFQQEHRAKLGSIVLPR